MSKGYYVSNLPIQGFIIDPRMEEMMRIMSRLQTDVTHLLYTDGDSEGSASADHALKQMASSEEGRKLKRYLAPYLAIGDEALGEEISRLAMVNSYLYKYLAGQQEYEAIRVIFASEYTRVAVARYLVANGLMH